MSALTPIPSSITWTSTPGCTGRTTISTKFASACFRTLASASWQIRKTVTALVTGAIGVAAVIVTSEPAALTSAEWLMAVSALATALGVYAVPNKQPDDAGQSVLVTALVAAAVCLLLLLVLESYSNSA